ncbi:MAG: TolC family protein [Alistipes sp.]|nr:TolC family protein [Alistipes sp.]MBQ5923947.1 TolC family protein [Alistipes sp.]
MKKLLSLLCLSLLSLGLTQAQQSETANGGTLALSLDEAIELALTDNPTVKVANLEIERYDYVRKQVVATLYPQVDASAQYSLAIRRQEMAQGLSFGGKNTFNVAGSVSLPLFVPAVYRQMKMTRTQMESAVESARATRIDLVAAVRAAYYNVLLAEQSLEVLNEAVVTTQRVVDNTRDLYENGLAAEYDYLTAQVQLSNLKPQVLQAQSAIEVTKLQLKMYLSIPEEVDVEVRGSLDDFRTQVLLGEDYTTDVSENTTLRSLDIQRDLLEHQEKLIQTSRMPTIAAFGQISYIGQERSDLGGLLGGAMGGASTAEQSKFWWQYPINVGAQISIPLFAGFKKTNQLREVRNQMKQLDIQRQYAEDGIRLQVEQSINTLITARETMLSNELTVEQATKAYDITLTRYNAGAGTILELNASQLSLTQAQLSYSQSIYDYLNAYAQYEKALGVETYVDTDSVE